MAGRKMTEAELEKAQEDWVALMEKKVADERSDRNEDE